LDGSLGLDDSDGSVDILWYNVSSVHQTASHVLSVSWIALGHHVGWLEDGVGQLGDRELFVVSLLSRDDWSVGAQHKVDSWVWHKVGLEFSDIDVQSTIETEGSSQRRDDLSNQSVQVGVSWLLNIQRSSADIVDGFIVQHKGDISVFQERVCGQYRVVWFYNSCGDLWGWVDAEIELGLLSIVNRQSFQEERSKSRSSSTTNRVEDEETLETSALIGEFSDSVEAQVDDFLSDGVVSSGVVVGG
jgi:hypothetical protein